MGLARSFVLLRSAEGAVRRRPPFFATKQVGIIGCTESVVHTPWADPRWTLVAHSSSRQHCRREPDWWIDLHPPSCFTKKKGWNLKYWEWLTHTTTPVFMQDNYPEIPAAVRYPKERILAECRPYFTNMTAWIIALAMSEGVTTIGLFGCQYKHEHERGKQRGSCEYWLGRFEGTGGRVVIPEPNGLLCTPKELYGYESHDAHGELIASYRSPPVVQQPDGYGGFANKNLTIVTDLTAPAPPHADLGEPVAWERSGFVPPAGPNGGVN